MLYTIDILSRIAGGISVCLVAGAAMLNAFSTAEASCDPYTGCDGALTPPNCEAGICEGTCTCGEKTEADGDKVCHCQV